MAIYGWKAIELPVIIQILFYLLNQLLYELDYLRVAECAVEIEEHGHGCLLRG